MLSKRVVLTIVLAVIVLSGTIIPLTGLSPTYASAPTSAPGEEPVYFNETGWGGPWSLNVSSMTIGNGYHVINGMRTYEAYQPDLTLYLNQGDYGYTAYVGLPGRLVTISNLFNVTNSSAEISLNFSEYSTGYRVSLNVSGLPQGVNWSPFIGTTSGMYLQAIKGPESPFLSNNSYEIYLNNGTYEYAVSSDNGAFYGQAWITVQGKPVDAILQMRMTANPIEFQATGIPDNASWQLNFTNVNVGNHTVTIPFMLKGNESWVFTWEQGVVNFTVSAPQGYVLTGMSINVLHFNTTANGTLTGGERNVTINISSVHDGRELNYSFWIGNHAGPIFPLTIPTNSSIHLTFYFKQVPKSTAPAPFPWYLMLLLVIGISAGTGGILDGNRRRRKNRGHKEDEARKQTPQPPQEPNPDDVLKEGEK